MATIQNVFVVMLENHSFDNVFAMSGIPGIYAATTSDSNTYNGTVYNVQNGAPLSMPTDPGHEFLDVLEQLCGPGSTYPPGGPYPPINNSGFVANYATTTSEGPTPPSADIGDIMDCFTTQSQYPVLYDLATQFAICDQWFSSLPGPTWPNRFFVHGASSVGLDHSPSTEDILEWETFSGFGYPGGSIYNALNDAGIRWRLYNDSHNIYSDDPNNGSEAGRIPQVSAIKDIQIWDVHSLSDFASDLQGNYPFQYTFIEPNYGNIENGTYEGGSSQHPMDDIAGGQNLVAAVYEAIRNSPLWENSLLIVTYDEHGGYYDSGVPPSAVPPGDTKNKLDKYGFTFDLLGVRVPAVVVSPWIPAGTVDHTVYDHSSVPRTVENLFSTSTNPIGPLTARDAAANDVLHLCSLAAARTDCPTTLTRPAQAVASRAPLTAAQQAAIDMQPVPQSGNLPGFLGIALKTDLALSGGSPEEQAAIIANFKTIQTRGQARAYISTVMGKADTNKARSQYA